MSCNFYESDSLLTFDDRRRASRYILILHAPFASICRCALSFLSSAHFCISAVRLAIYIGKEIISAWTRPIETNVNREGKKTGCWGSCVYVVWVRVSSLVFFSSSSFCSGKRNRVFELFDISFSFMVIAL